MTKLLYHHSSNQVATSPFDEAILMVANRKAIKVVSPYIGLNYLQRIVKMSAGWSLISDVEAWLSSLTVSERGRTWAFIQENLGSIRHLPALHAKVVIGPDSAYLGSANLTSAGILSSTEMVSPTGV